MQIIQTQPEPRPLCTVVTQLMAAQPNRPRVLEQAASPEVSSAAADPSVSQQGSTRSKKRRRADAEVFDSLPGGGSTARYDEATAGRENQQQGDAAQLPLEARPLASLAAFATEVVAELAHSAPVPPGVHEMRPRNKKSKTNGSAADLESLLQADPVRCVAYTVRRNPPVFAHWSGYAARPADYPMFMPQAS